MLPLHTDCLQLRLSESEGDSDSDSGSKSSRKKVHFLVNCDENSSPERSGRRPRKVASKGHHIGLSALTCGRSEIPDGSDTFRQVLREIENENPDGDEECVQLTCSHHRTCDQPLKSILKKK